MVLSLLQTDRVLTEIAPSIHTVAPTLTPINHRRKDFKCFCLATDIPSAIKVTVFLMVKFRTVTPHLSLDRKADQQRYQISQTLKHSRPS
jgi:hypothetical protein